MILPIFHFEVEAAFAGHTLEIVLPITLSAGGVTLLTISTVEGFKVARGARVIENADVVALGINVSVYALAAPC